MEKMKKKSPFRLPLNEDTLHHHLDWVHYLSYLLKPYELKCHSSDKMWEGTHQRKALPCSICSSGNG